MFHRVASWIRAGVVSLVVLGGVSIAAATNNFLGVWQVVLTPDSDTEQDGGKAFGENMIFTDDDIMSENFAFYGFFEGAVSVNSDDPNQFTATMESGQKGDIAWSGTKSGSTITGILVWTKHDGKVWRYTYRGSKSN
jgi:hypothetical protein